MTDTEVIKRQIVRRQELLDQGIGLGELDEYNVLTLNIAQSASKLLRAVEDVIALRDELLATPDGPAAPVAKAFGLEIDRALKGQRR